jgi:hypothetical protein
MAHLVSIPLRAAETKEPAMYVGAAPDGGSGSAVDRPGCTKVLSAQLPAMPAAAATPKRNTSRRVSAGTRVIS